MALLYDPEVTNYRDQQAIAKMIAHEQAHMWFGNCRCEMYNESYKN